MANAPGCFDGCMIDLVKIAAFLFLWLECDIPFWCLVFSYVAVLVIESWQKDKKEKTSEGEEEEDTE